VTASKVIDGTGRLPQALEGFQEVMDSQETVFGGDHDDTLDTMAGLAEALSKLSRYGNNKEFLTSF
jgi:hypothetical protein